MTNDDGRKPEGAPERSPKAGVGAPSGVDGNGPKRFSVQRKMAIVARLLRGEPVGASREMAPGFFLLGERWGLARDCGGASRWNWWRGRRMSRSPGSAIG